MQAAEVSHLSTHAEVAEGCLELYWSPGHQSSELHTSPSVAGTGGVQVCPSCRMSKRAMYWLQALTPGWQ